MNDIRPGASLPPGAIPPAPHIRATVHLDRLEAVLAELGYEESSLAEIAEGHLKAIRGIVRAHQHLVGGRGWAGERSSPRSRRRA